MHHNVTLNVTLGRSLNAKLKSGYALTVKTCYGIAALLYLFYLTTQLKPHAGAYLYNVIFLSHKQFK